MKVAINSAQAPAAVGPYSQGIRTANYVFLSGQIPLEPDTGRLVEDDITAQTEQVISNIKALLNSQHLDLNDVVKATVFLIDMNDFTAMNNVYAKHFHGLPPARSTVQVARLPKDARVEIEVIAQTRNL